MKKEISPVLLLILSIVLTMFLTPFGLIHIAAKSIYHTFRIKFWIGPLIFINYWLNVLYQIWNVIKYLCLKIAISIDLLGNVTCGEAIEDCVTIKEITLYGKGDVTISTATGELEYKKELNNTGIKFSKVLSLLLDKNHCIESYKRHLHNKNFEL